LVNFFVRVTFRVFALFRFVNIKNILLQIYLANFWFAFSGQKKRERSKTCSGARIQLGNARMFIINPELPVVLFVLNRS